MNLNHTRHKKAIDFALDILKRKPYNEYIDKIYLFGSCAKQCEKYDSDVDLLVQCDETPPPELARRMRVDVMPEALDLPEIDLKFVTANTWRIRNDHFSRNLVKESILLWKKR